MSKDSVKKVPWDKTVLEIEEISGIPRKQIDEVANQIVVGIESIIEKNQPKRDGDMLSLETPFATFDFLRYGAQNVQTPEGKQVVRPTCVGANSTIPRRFVLKANIGLIDKATEESEKKKSKSA
jgi:hypothetical protein